MNIFISYRHEDTSAEALNLRLQLEKTFPAATVFFDTSSIKFGDWRIPVRQALAACDVLLAVMGPNWVGELSDGSRRIDRDDDEVRFEVTTALARDDVEVVPILIPGAEFPDWELLPEPLKTLPFQHARRPGRRESWEGEVHVLIRDLKAIDADTQPVENQFAAVTVRGELRWLWPKATAGPLIARSRQHSPPPARSSLALSSDGVVAAQVIKNALTIWALCDSTCGSYERWRSLRLDDSWQRPRVVAIGRFGTSRVRMAVSYERGPSNARKVARFDVDSSSPIEHHREYDTEAGSGAFVGSRLLFMDQVTRGISTWPDKEAAPQRWSTGLGLKARWIDAAIVDGDVLIVVLGLDLDGGGEDMSVVSFRTDVDVPDGSWSAPARARQLVIARGLHLSGGLQIAIRSAKWSELPVAEPIDGAMGTRG